jgi:small-conductance mechanosensitive channel
MSIFEKIGIIENKYLLAIVVLLLWAVVSKIIVIFVDKVIRKATEKTRTRIDDIIIHIIDTPLLILLFLGGLWVTVEVLAPPDRFLSIFRKLILSLSIIIAVFVLTRLLGAIIKEYGARIAHIRPVMGAAERIVQVIILAVGGILLLDTLGVKVTSLVATLGLGGIIIGLALQDTLANYFAGFYIMVDQPVRVGDYIKLDSGEEGYVISIGWRSTKIRNLPNNIIIIPNQKLSSAVITNYHLSEPQMSVIVKVGVSYDSDPRKVEKILYEVGKEAADEMEEVIKDFDPLVRFCDFGDSSLDFILIVRVKEFVNQYKIASEIRQKIFARFKKEEIEIPFPIRTVYLKNAKEEV